MSIKSEGHSEDDWKWSSRAKQKAEQLARDVRDWVDSTEGIDTKAFAGELYYYFGQLMAEWQRQSEDIQLSRREPMWLEAYLTLRAQRGESSIDTSDSALGFRVDHTFYGIDSHRQADSVLVSEPYAMTLSEVKSLVEFCEENGLDAVFEGKSRHFPGHTFRVELFQAKEEEYRQRLYPSMERLCEADG